MNEKKSEEETLGIEFFQKIEDKSVDHLIIKGRILELCQQLSEEVKLLDLNNLSSGLLLKTNGVCLSAWETFDKNYLLSANKENLTISFFLEKESKKIHFDGYGDNFLQFRVLMLDLISDLKELRIK